MEIPCGTPAGEYKVRVGRFENPELYACSEAFMIVNDEDSGDSSEDSTSSDDSSSDDDESMSYSF